MSTTEKIIKKATFERLQQKLSLSSKEFEQQGFDQWLINIGNIHRFKTDEMYRARLKTL